MEYAITLPEEMMLSLKDREKTYLRIVISYNDDDLILYPNTIAGDASEDYQKWSLSFKNYGEFQEGLFGSCSARIDYSHDGLTWVQVFAGYVTTNGMNRTNGRITDDHVSMELVDITKTKGMTRKAPQQVLTNFKICDPGDPTHSLVHYLGSLMGIDQFDTSYIMEQKDVVIIGSNPIWRELQLLQSTFAADMYFDSQRQLRFRSPHELLWTEPASEWTFIADPFTPETVHSSRVIGKIQTVRRDVICNKAESEIEIYEHLSMREVYRNTENWNAETEECSITISPGEYWPSEGVASLQYKNPVTGEEYVYATNVEAPTIGKNSDNEIYYTGDNLELFSFNGSTSQTEQEPGASQIILHNSGSTDVVIRKFIINGEPFSHTKTQKVTERDASVLDDVDLVEKTIDGKYATSVSQIGKTLKRLVDEGKIRPRMFSFSTIFLPQIQRGMGCTLITDKGESVECKLLTYNHKASGNTLATMRTSVIVEETANYYPEYNPRILEKPISPVQPIPGPPGEDAYQIQVISNEGDSISNGTRLFYNSRSQGLAGWGRDY